MTQLTEEMYAIFDRDEFSFKKLKSQYSEDELAQIKTDFKEIWQTWKEINLMFIKNHHKINLLKFMLKVGPMVGTYAIITGSLSFECFSR